MEILDLYDDNLKLLNETIVRGNKPGLGKNVMLSVVFIKNNDNYYLIQKNSKVKGSKFSTTGGHVEHNENGLDTIVREVSEELGLVINKDDLNLVITFKYPDRNCIFNVYTLINNNSIDDFKIQKEEVEEVKWMSKNEIINLINDDLFLESHAYIYKTYIEINN